MGGEGRKKSRLPSFYTSSAGHHILITGEINFTDPAGKPIPGELKEGGKYFIPVTEEGQPSWKLSQAHLSVSPAKHYTDWAAPEWAREPERIPGRTGPKQYRNSDPFYGVH